MSIASTKKSKSKPVFPDHSTSYSYFYRYSSFILFAKQFNHDLYLDIRELYCSPASKSLKEAFTTFVAQFKSIGRKNSSEDLEFIFSLVKEPSGTVSAVRSAAIKRTSTVSRVIR